MVGLVLAHLGNAQQLANRAARNAHKPTCTPGRVLGECLPDTQITLASRGLFRWLAVRYHHVLM